MLYSFLITCSFVAILFIMRFFSDLSTCFFNTFSILGTITGIVGLWFSYKSWKNTDDILSATYLEKIKKEYPNIHYEFANSINKALTALQKGSREWQIVYNLYDAFSTYRQFYDNIDVSFREIIDEANKWLHKLQRKDSIDDETNEILQNNLAEIQAMLKRISILYNLKQNQQENV